MPGAWDGMTQRLDSAGTPNKHLHTLHVSIQLGLPQWVLHEQERNVYYAKTLMLWDLLLQRSLSYSGLIQWFSDTWLCHIMWRTWIYLVFLSLWAWRSTWAELLLSEAREFHMTQARVPPPPWHFHTWPWTSYGIFLSLGFPICKIGMMMFVSGLL